MTADVMADFQAEMDRDTPSVLDGLMPADWLLEQVFPPVQYVVDGLIPEGLSLLIAAPKIGKSWLCLGLGLAVAGGEFAFGAIEVQQRPVLYLALEDGPKRLQARMRTLNVAKGPTDLFFATETPGGLHATIEEFIKLHADRNPVVMLDTLGKVMPPAMPNETTYQRDYRVTGSLKRLVDRSPGASMIVVHHTRKQEASDFLDAVSGTNGIAGAADTILVLKRDREDKGATLHVTSRDAKEGSYSLQFEENGRWSLNGDSLTEASVNAKVGELTQGVGDRMADIITYVASHPDGVTPKDVARDLDLGDSEARQYLRRAHEAGRVSRPKRGLYTPLSHVSHVSLSPAESDTSYTSYTTPREDDDD